MKYKRVISPTIVALLIIISFSASCISFLQSVKNQQNPEVATTKKPVLQNETDLERNKRIWTESNLKNYKITLESTISDALYSTSTPVEIEVRENKAISIKNLAKGEKPISMEEAKSDYGLMLYERRGIDSLERMFELIKRAEDGKTDKGFKTILLEVEYDPKYGYPTNIKYDIAATDSYVSVKVIKVKIVEP